MELLSGSIRHECLNRVIVTSEEHLRKVLMGYFRIFSIQDHFQIGFHRETRPRRGRR
jgi:hypothetical protein